MMRSSPCLAVLAATLGALGGGACGDNGRACGTGTRDLHGVCVPSTTTTCGDGTKLDNGVCVIDPAACPAGTVLVAGRCVEPDRNLMIDLEESFEPNGLGVAPGVEASASPAGAFVLAPRDIAVVLHGHLTPFRDADGDGQLDPDVDTYQLTAAAPTLVEITVDGVGGAQGAFYLAGDPTGVVPSYERYGLNLTGDTAKRQLFLPAPGVYFLAITDTRALAIGSNPPPPAGAGGAAGGPDAEYYATITARAQPAPSEIPAAALVASASGSLTSDQVALFTGPFVTGSNHVLVAMPGAAAASVAVLDDQLVHGYADEKAAPPQPAEVVISDIPAGHTPIIVVDTAYNYGPGAEPFTLTIDQP
jgi:hypothetical protein